MNFVNVGNVKPVRVTLCACFSAENGAECSRRVDVLCVMGIFIEFRF